MGIKYYICLVILVIFSPKPLNSQVIIKRNNQARKDLANLNWNKEFTLFDYTTDEPIFPLIRNGQAVYKIYYTSKEDPRPNYGEFTVTQVEDLKYYKFKNRETCLKFCLANKLIVVPTLTTISISTIASTSAASGGNITSDGGATITARGVVWATTSNPIIVLSTKTTDGTGTGSFTSTLTNLTPKTTYYVRAYATNSAGTGYGNEISFTTLDSSKVKNIPCPGTPTFKDIDGNTYNTVQIGTQCWTKENLRVTKYRDGSVIPLDESGGTVGNETGETWSSRTTGARTVYGHSAANLTTYGYLYNWYAASDLRGICPMGWHVPSDEEWTNLTNYLGGESVAGGKLRSTGTTFWNSPNLGANNESGFTALPGGFRSRGDGNFLYNKYYAFFWSSTEVWFRLLTIGNERVDKNDDFSNGTKSAGISVRCIKDTISFVTLPTLTTTDITAITTSSATSGGNIAADGGSSITARGVVWATTSNPTISLTTKTSDGTGTGSFTSDLTNLTTKTTYYVRAYATNSAGSGYGNEISFTTLDSSKVMNIPCLGTPTVKDIDGNTYNTVQIGTQCWMKENLKVSRYKNGDAIPIVTDNTTWNNLSTGARCWYDNDSISYEEPYGNLYNWYATSDSRGICPTGWHVPTDAEWTTLTTYLGGESVAGGKMKSVGTTFWNSPNTGATNESSFSALPGSFRSFDGNYSHKSIFAFFWSTTVSGNMYSWGHTLYHGSSSISRRNDLNREMGASVRCLRD